MTDVDVYTCYASEEIQKMHVQLYNKYLNHILSNKVQQYNISKPRNL